MDSPQNKPKFQPPKKRRSFLIFYFEPNGFHYSFSPLNPFCEDNTLRFRKLGASLSLSLCDLIGAVKNKIRCRRRDTVSRTSPIPHTRSTYFHRRKWDLSCKGVNSELEVILSKPKSLRLVLMVKSLNPKVPPVCILVFSLKQILLSSALILKPKTSTTS